MPGTERVLTGRSRGSLPSAPRSRPTFCSICSSSRRHCTSFFRYWSSFSFTRNSTWGQGRQADTRPKARATLAHNTLQPGFSLPQGPRRQLPACTKTHRASVGRLLQEALSDFSLPLAHLQLTGAPLAAASTAVTGALRGDEAAQPVNLL